MLVASMCMPLLPAVPRASSYAQGCDVFSCPLLQAIAASWKSLPLDMVDYKATCKLRSTEDIFAVLEENSVMLSTMKVRKLHAEIFNYKL